MISNLTFEQLKGIDRAFYKEFGVTITELEVDCRKRKQEITKGLNGMADRVMIAKLSGTKADFSDLKQKWEAA